MRASPGDGPPAIAEADADAVLRMRIAIADATFVAEGVTLGLLLMWAERAPPFDDLPAQSWRGALQKAARECRPPDDRAADRGRCG